ncbi:MAG: MarR family winged helix-turn-helix transcriptional regulator [Chloroflexota bacterium]
MTIEPVHPNYQAMAELRYQIRRFLRFSENAARQAGIEPQQHQLLMAIKGLPAGTIPNIRILAERMQLQHHSTVELIDHLAERGFLCRLRATDDRRQVLVKLTQEGEQFLEKLTLHHLQEWQSAGPMFVKLLQSVIENPEESASTEEISAKSEIEASSNHRKDINHG